MSSAPPVRLLIVDDKAAQVAALTHALRIEGFATTGVESSRVALDLIRASIAPGAQSIDVLITDLMMPEMDGIALLGAAQEIDRHLVSIVMTGHATIDTAVEAMKRGALDYIEKPVNLSVAVPALRRAVSIRRLRAENEALIERVAERTAEVETANRELRAANRELEAFASSLSHDMRQPLYAVVGFCELLLSEADGPLNEAQKKYVAETDRGGRRLLRLTEDLLRFSKLTQQPLTKQDVSVDALLAEICAELRAADSQRAVDVRIGPLPRVSGDPGLLRQVFANLLSNAFKFTRNTPQAVIEVTGQSLEGESLYTVRDNGAGFDMKKADELFGIFRRLHEPSEFEGTGVGLSLVRRIVERHGGRVSAEGHVGRGARFTIALPR